MATCFSNLSIFNNKENVWNNIFEKSIKILITNLNLTQFIIINTEIYLYYKNRIFHWIDFFLFSMANSGLGKMHLDLYTQNSGLTHKAKFWCNYVSALKGESNLWYLICLDNLHFINMIRNRAKITNILLHDIIYNKCMKS